ncbi:MAG: cytoplasmic protein [Proteobacteria bacterium]|nr:cytoplasmic protein [Pseudomonadota bacterium]
MDHPNDPTTDHDERARERRQLLALLAPLLTLAPRDVLAQDAAGVQPRAYRVALENEKLRVLEFQSRPGLGVCGEGMHSHPPHLTVVLTPAKVRVKQPDGKVFEAENKAGDVFWSEAETHEVENITGRNMRALIIELKNKA